MSQKEADSFALRHVRNMPHVHKLTNRVVKMKELVALIG